MKKSILNLGNVLNKIQQKSINAGDGTLPSDSLIDCLETMCINMPNPDYNMGPFDPLGGPDQNGLVFVTGV